MMATIQPGSMNPIDMQGSRQGIWPRPVELLTLLAVLAACLRLYPLAFGGLNAFASSIDHAESVFQDMLSYYWLQAQQSAADTFPIGGFLYPATAALFFRLFTGLGEHLSVLLWAAILFLGSASLWWCGYVALFSGVRRNQRSLLAWLLLCALSHPFAHNWMWGQISILLTVLLLAAVCALRVGRESTAAALIALAASFKLYPMVFALILVPQWRPAWNWLRPTMVFLVVLASALMLPGLVFSWDGAMRFNEAALLNAINPPPFWKDPNAQSLTAMVSRFWPGFSADWSRLLSLAGFVTLLLVHACAIIRRRQLGEFGAQYHAALVFCALPLVVPSSWPHYFVFLPFVQVLAWLLVHDAPLPVTGRHARHAVLAAAAFASSMPGFLTAPNWLAYSTHGYLFWSDMAVLLVLLSVPAPQAVPAPQTATGKPEAVPDSATVA